MQTFLPHPDVRASAAALDDRRLGKQRVETFQVLRALTWPRYGWKNHPVVRMWRGFTAALVCYGIACTEEWEARGFADSTRPSLLGFSGGSVPGFDALADAGQLPPWLGDERVHVSHRSALVRKDPAHYGPLFPGTPEDLPYHWPPPAFPRWPLRRSGAEPLALPEALALLGLSQASEAQRLAVDAVSSGRDHVLAGADPEHARTAGLLAGLCTPGATVWLAPGPPPPRAAVPPRPPAARPGSAGQGRTRRGPSAGTASSSARPPSPEDLAAMAAEAAAAAEFRFVHPGQRAEAAWRDVGLVVAEAAAPATDAIRVPVLKFGPAGAEAL